MLTVLEKKAQIEMAREMLRDSLAPYASEAISVTIGYQGGNCDAPVTWLPSLGIWAYFGYRPGEKSPGRRFWNVFGIGKPSGMVGIVCEINPPLQGIDRRVQGAFARSSDGRLSVVHRGRFNIRGGITKGFFKKHYRGPYIPVNDGSRISYVIHVGKLSSQEFGESLRNFVVEVDRIKALGRSSPSR